MLRTLTCLLTLALLGGIGDLHAGQPLRIMHFNAEILIAPGVNNSSRLQRYRWDEARTAHFERVAAIIEAANPDIVNLVEVTSVEGVELLIKMLHEKGLTNYQGYHIESSDTFTGMDVALITKIKPDEIEGESIRHLYSGGREGGPWRSEYEFTDEDGQTRTLSTGISRHAVYYVTVGDHKLGFLGLHLKAIPNDPYSNAKRMGEMGVAQKIIRKEIVDRGYTPIVLGDLNDYDPDVPDRDESRSTQTTVLVDLKDYDLSQEGPELFNVASRIPRQADRWTSLWDRNENGVADPYDVQTMLDHILLPKQFEPYLKRAYINHAIDPLTSDHRPVVVDLELP